MSALNIRRLLQRVVSTVTQPLTIGGIAEDGSDAKIVITADGEVQVGGKKIANSLLAEYEVTGAAVTSIDFSGLDINTHKSYRIEIEAYNPAATESFVYLYINNDTVASNYYSQQQKTDGTGVTAGRSNSAALFWVGAGQRMSGDAKLAITPGWYAMAVSDHTSNPSSLLVRQIYALVKTATVTNITQLTFTASVANAIGIGSKVRIYRGDV